MGYEPRLSDEERTAAGAQQAEDFVHAMARSFVKLWATRNGVKVDSVEHDHGAFYTVIVDGDHYQITFANGVEHFVDFDGIAWCTDGLVDVDGQLVPRFMTVEDENGDAVRFL